MVEMLSISDPIINVSYFLISYFKNVMVGNQETLQVALFISIVTCISIYNIEYTIYSNNTIKIQ